MGVRWTRNVRIPCWETRRSLQLLLLFIVIITFSFTIRRVYYFSSGGDGISLQPSCSFKKHVVFLKTHKTASSTILNILYRFGDARNLTFALPIHNHLGYPNRFKAEFVQNFAKDHTVDFNIICNHMRFYLPEVKRVMPNESFYFSIIRNPIQLAESSFAYFYSSSAAFKRALTLEEFLSHPEKYYKLSDQSNFFSRNIMWFDFGYDNNAEDTQEYVNAALRELERAFDLILIADYFDESLVLLKEALCWEIEDVVYFKLNARKSTSVRLLEHAMAEKVKAWHSLDWKLYCHFNASFWLRVASYGLERMQQDVSRLRELSQRLRSTCLEGDTPVVAEEIKAVNFKPYNSGKAKIVGYNLKSNLTSSVLESCWRMAMPEAHFLTHLQKKQTLSWQPKVKEKNTRNNGGGPL